MMRAVLKAVDELVHDDFYPEVVPRAFNLVVLFVVRLEVDGADAGAPD